VPNVLKSGSLNLLVTSGPVQACHGIALPFIITVNWFANIVWPEHNFGKNSTNCGSQPDDTIVVSNLKFIFAVPLRLTINVYPLPVTRVPTPNPAPRTYAVDTSNVFGNMRTCIYCVLYCLYCVFSYCFVYVYLFLFVLSVLV